MALERKDVAVRRHEAIEFRKCRRLAFAEIGPEDAALFHDGVGTLLDALAQFRTSGFRRCFQALTADIEQPAMEGAAQAAGFQPAEGEVGAAVRAMAIDQAVAAALVAGENRSFD